MQRIFKPKHFLLLFFILYAATGALQNAQKLTTPKENGVTFVRWLGVDDKENIIVYDGKEVCFKVFDKNGKFT